MKPITIIGGGLAGLTLGVALRQREVPVTVFEAGRYPRHRVCGEFVSGRGREVLRRQGLEEKLFAAGARSATTAAFYSRRGRELRADLPEPALCLTRYAMDALLAAELAKLGGQLRVGVRRQEEPGEGVVRATGRRTKAAVKGWRWFGLKAHARGARLAADVEVHLLPQGYVGLCRVTDELVNVCGLFRSRTAVPDLAQNWPGWLRGEGSDNEALHARLEDAEFSFDSFCSVSGLCLRPQSAAEHPGCCVGDAVTMIAPFTGNGMSMAFESAELASGPLSQYSEGKTSWETAQSAVAQGCDQTFGGRLKWSRLLQNQFFNGRMGGALISLGNYAPGLWRFFYSRTR